MIYNTRLTLLPKASSECLHWRHLLSFQHFETCVVKVVWCSLAARHWQDCVCTRVCGVIFAEKGQWLLNVVPDCYLVFISIVLGWKTSIRLQFAVCSSAWIRVGQSVCDVWLWKFSCVLLWHVSQELTFHQYFARVVHPKGLLSLGPGRYPFQEDFNIFKASSFLIIWFESSLKDGSRCRRWCR